MTSLTQSNRFSIQPILNYLAIIYACLLPFHQFFQSIQILSYLIAVQILLVIYTFIVVKSFKGLLKKQYLPLIGFYAFFALSLLWSSNTDYGFQKIVLYLPLLFFPLYFSLAKVQHRQIYSAFILSCTAALLWCIARATYLYLTTSSTQYFFYNYLSDGVNLHPTYLSFYVLAAIIMLFVLLKNQSNHFLAQKKTQFLGGLLIVFFSGIIYLLSSRIVLIAFLLLVLILCLYYVLFSKKIFLTVTVFAALMLFMYAAYQLTPSLQNRVNQLVDITTGKTELSTAHAIHYRVVAWESAVTLWKGHFLTGTGIGDVQDKLNVHYETIGIETLSARNFNVHNQFLQSAVAGGVIGLGFLLSFWIVGFVRSVQTRDLVLAAFLFVSFVIFLTEAILEAQGGVLFFGFFISLMYAKPAA